IEPNDPRIHFVLASARAAVGADAVQGYSYDPAPTAGSFSGPTGRDTIVGILDQGGLSADHPAFWKMNADGVLKSSPGRIGFTEASAPNPHTSHVAGIVGGSGGDTPINCGGAWALRGIAPECTLVATI